MTKLDPVSAKSPSPVLQVTLLLCSPLRAARNKNSQPLSLGEFNAMQRNKQIYALADFGLAVSSGHNEGGAWPGAIEQLDKYHLVPLFMRDGDDVPEGNRELLQRGALSFPSEPEPDSARDFFEAAIEKSPQFMETEDMFALRETPTAYRRGGGRKSLNENKT